MIDVLGGHSQLISSASPRRCPDQGGKVKALGYAANKARQGAAECPDHLEAGVPGLSPSSGGVCTPGRNAQPIVDKLNREIAAIMKTPEMIKAMDDQGADIDL
jgi:tripartite-type tricarboxylate transporter receptor subunit TctC